MVLQQLQAVAAQRVLDLGCGDGEFLLPLVGESWVQRVVGVEPAAARLASVQRAIGAMEPAHRDKVTLLQGSVLDSAPWLAMARDCDAAVMIEVIEHLDPSQLSGLERVLFRDLAPRLAILTTPNADFNRLLGVPDHRFRHPDHKFEWGRARFGKWAEAVAGRVGSSVTLHDLAGRHPDLGGASQMAVFVRQT